MVQRRLHSSTRRHQEDVLPSKNCQRRTAHAAFPMEISCLLLFIPVGAKWVLPKGKSLKSKFKAKKNLHPAQTQRVGAHHLNCTFVKYRLFSKQL